MTLAQKNKKYLSPATGSPLQILSGFKSETPLPPITDPVAGHSLRVDRYAGGEIRYQIKVPILSRPKRDGIPKRSVLVDSSPKGFGRVLSGINWPSCPLPLGNNHDFQRSEPTGLDLPRAGWGGATRSGSQLTTHGKRSLQRGCCSLEQEFGKERIAFATFTLPGRSPAAIQCLSRWTGYVMNRLMVFARRHIAIEGDLYWQSWWEPHRDGTLHFHAAMVIPDGMEVATVSDLIQKQWWEILENISDKENVDLFERKNGDSWRYRKDNVTSDNKRIIDRACDVQLVKKSVARYMATYMKKQHKSEAKYCPSQWWSQTRAIKRLIKKYHHQTLIYGVEAEEAHGFLTGCMDLASSDDVEWSTNLINPYSGEVIGGIIRCDESLAGLVYDALAGLAKDISTPSNTRHREAIKGSVCQSLKEAKLQRDQELEDQAWEAVLRERYGGRGWYRDKRGNWRDGYARAKWLQGLGRDPLSPYPPLT